MLLHFITTVTHDRYIKFLTPHLESIFKTHPDARVTVFYNDISQHQLKALSIHFSKVIFKPQPLLISESKEKTISGKVRWFLHEALLLDDGSNVVFIDCDSLVVKPLYEFFDTSFDLAFTWKDDGFPLNTGVLLARTGRNLATMLNNWRQKIETIFQNDDLELARRIAGAADQFALMQILLGDSGANMKFSIDERNEIFGGSHVLTIEDTKINLFGFTCKELNETHCCPISDMTHVVHYKSGWHQILLDGARFTTNRPQPKCQEMFDFWKISSRESQKSLAESILLNVQANQEQKYVNLNLGWTEHGILHSEMLSICATAEMFGIKRIIESGRWLGQSTLVLSKYFQGTSVQIISIELFRNSIGRLCEERLSGQDNVRLLYGDAFNLIPSILIEEDSPTALLLDGPKGREAVKLIASSFKTSPKLLFAYLHDCYRTSEAREAVINEFPGSAFTDHPKYIFRFSYLDNGLIFRNAGQGKYTGEIGTTDIGLSYGPTLGFIIPNISQVGTANSTTIVKAITKTIFKIRYFQAKGIAVAREWRHQSM